MKKQVRLTHNSQVKANDVVTENADTWDGSAGGKKNRLALNGYVTESTRLLAARQRAIDDRTAATERCRFWRTALRSLNRTIVKVGKLVNQPEKMTDTLAVAGPMSDADLQAHMQSLHDRVLPFIDTFLAEGLPPGTLTDLVDGIKGLEAARAAVAATIQDAASAEQALRENQKLARNTIHALESMAPRTTTAERELITKLKTARRVGPHKTQPDDPASSTPSSSTPPASLSEPSTVPPSTAKAS